MNAAEINELLVSRFGADRIVGANMTATDPWVEVAPAAIVEVSMFLRDDPRLQMDHLNNLCGVDYLQPDPKKAAKFGHEPHIEVVYHLSSFVLKHKITLKVKLPRWKNDQPGQTPRGRLGRRRVGHRRLARAGNLRFDGHPFSRPPQPLPHPLSRGLGGPSPPQRLRDAARVPRNSGPLNGGRLSAHDEAHMTVNQI